MTTAHDIERSLYDWAPRELAMAWDNVGLLVGDPAQEVRKVLVALDITQGVAEEAVSLGAQMIVSHHPVMNCAWHEVQTLRADDAQGRLLRYLVRHGLAACCMHTNLDAADGGVNDCLAHALGLSGLSMLNEEKIGRIGTLSCEIPLEEFLPAVVKSLGCSGLRFRDGGKPVHRVAVGGLPRLHPAGHRAGLRYLRHRRPALQRLPRYPRSQPHRRRSLSDRERRVRGGPRVSREVLPSA